MTDRNVLIIKNSWSYIITQSDHVGESFYKKLFELDPCLIPMFQNDIEHQAKKMMDMLTYMVMNLQNMQNIQDDIDALAKRHVHYGTKPEQYQTVGQALIWVLQNSLGDEWDEEIGQSWMDLYNLCASSMIKASNSIQP